MPEKPLDCCFTAIQTNSERCQKCEHRALCLEQLDIEFKKAVVKSQRVIKTERTGRIVLDPNDQDKINSFSELVSKLKKALELQEINLEVDSEAFCAILHEYLDSHEVF